MKTATLIGVGVAAVVILVLMSGRKVAAKAPRSALSTTGNTGDYLGRTSARKPFLDLADQQVLDYNNASLGTGPMWKEPGW